jgi:hypothetical protein
MSDLLDLLGLVKLLKSPCTGSGPRLLKSLVLHEDVKRRRNLSCAEYDGCLDTAYRSGWRSWTCEHCRFFSLASDYRDAGVAQAAVSRSDSALQ